MSADEIRSWEVWQRMPRLSLEEIRSVRLMNRTDTKYVAHRDALAPLLDEALRCGYAVQYTDGSTVGAYDTTYYDTPDHEMYLLHHNRHLARQKVRCRTYVGSQLSFLEIKNKNNKGRTRKIRIPIEEPSPLKMQDDPRTGEFLRTHTPYSWERLQPALRTRFDRITLVNGEKTERLTIDTALRFDNCRNGRSETLPHLLIIELKQDSLCPSLMRRILLEMRIHPFKLSKYCIGTALTDPLIKANRFKRKIHLIRKLSHPIP